MKDGIPNSNSFFSENNQHDDDHYLTSIETPIRSDAFEIDDELKIELIEKNFREIMEILGLDLSDDSLKDTPKRVAKMYVKEIFKGLDPRNKPSVLYSRINTNSIRCF